MATQHPLAFARATGRRKPSSRAAQRREMAARASSVRNHERSTSPKASGKRTEYAAGCRKHSHRPRATSPPKAAPKPAEPRSSSKRAQSNQSRKQSHNQSHKQSRKPTVDRTSGSASRQAWAEMQQKMSEAAAK
eukprot:8214555-Pyramimonas_sp.AAC.2